MNGETNTVVVWGFFLVRLHVRAVVVSGAVCEPNKSSDSLLPIMSSVDAV